MSALIGGALIGAAVSLVLLTHGRRAGISGLWAGVLHPEAHDRAFRGWFFAGLVAAGAGAGLFVPQAFGVPAGAVGPAIAAGLLVGYGTQLGGGCTSGHGVCGLARFEVRALVATVTFMLTGALAVLASRAWR